MRLSHIFLNHRSGEGESSNAMHDIHSKKGKRAHRMRMRRLPNFDIILAKNGADNELVVFFWWMENHIPIMEKMGTVRCGCVADNGVINVQGEFIIFFHVHISFITAFHWNWLKRVQVYYYVVNIAVEIFFIQLTCHFLCISNIHFDWPVVQATELEFSESFLKQNWKLEIFHAFRKQLVSREIQK